MHLAILALFFLLSPDTSAEARCEAAAVSIDLGNHDAKARWVEQRAVIRVPCINDSTIPVQGYLLVELAEPHGNSWLLYNSRGDLDFLFGTHINGRHFAPGRRLCVRAVLPPGTGGVTPVPLTVRLRLPGDTSGDFQASFPYRVAFLRERPEACYAE